MRYSPPYSAYARIYDQIGQRAFGERMAAVILTELAKLGQLPTTVIDLGCGTGSATLAFARAGLRATGIDRSPEMLERARALANAESLDVSFIHGDMLEPQVDSTVDLVTCVYDAANYLDDDAELRRLFSSVSGLLEPDGAFVFDLNTRHRLSNSWEQGLMLAGDSPDLYVTYRSWFDETIDASPLIVTGFERVSDDCWRRFDEEHIERSWPIDQVITWLADAGFKVELVAGYIDSTGDLIHPAREDHGRVLFIAGR